MVAKVTITTTVEADGSVRLPESQIQLAGIQPGDQVRIEIVKDVEPPGRALVPGPDAVDRIDVADHPVALDADELAALSFDEWLAYGRSLVSFEGLRVEEIIRQGEDAAADEWWERFHQDE